MSYIEGVIIIVTIRLAKQRYVLVCNDYRMAMLSYFLHCIILVEHSGIEFCLVIGTETSHIHAVQSVVVCDFHLKVAHYEVGEIKSCQLIEHLVLIHRVGFIDQHECKWHVTFQ